MKRSLRDSPQRVFLILSAATTLCQAVTFGTYVLFLKEGIGLSPLEINIVNLCFYACRFLLEIPTGAVADVFGRKASFVLACFLYSAGLCLYWFATSMAGAILGEVVLALGATCASGAFEAWMVDELIASGEGDQLAKITSRRSSYNSLALGLGAPVGSLLAWYFGLATPWLVGGILNAFVGIAAYLLMRESRASHATGKAHRALIDTVRRSVTYAVSPGNVRFFLLLGILWGFAMMAPNMQWAPLFKDSVGTGASGLLFSGMVGLMVVGSRAAPYVIRRFGERTALAIALAAVGIGIILTPLFPFAFSLAPFALLEFFRGMYEPIKATTLNHAIDSDDRASVLSCEEMASKFGGMLGLFITGVLAEYVSFSAAWAAGGLVCLLGAYLITKNRATRPVPVLVEDPL